MTLSVKERILLLGILPKEGNIATLRIVGNLRSALSFSEEDHAKFGLRIEGDQIKWDPSVEQDAEIEIGPKAFVLIGDSLKSLEADSKLGLDFVSLWDKFCSESA
jgi:hypothetical protein